VTSQISLPGKFKGKLTNGFLAIVYSPVSQKEQIETMKEQKVCCMLEHKKYSYAIWSSKQNNKLAIRLKRFHERFGRSIEIVAFVIFRGDALYREKIV